MAASATKGILTIYLNGEIIYESQFGTLTPAPISLKKSFILNETTWSIENINDNRYRI